MRSPARCAFERQLNAGQRLKDHGFRIQAGWYGVAGRRTTDIDIWQIRGSRRRAAAASENIHQFAQRRPLLLSVL
jgi:hypothetical protein